MRWWLQWLLAHRRRLHLFDSHSEETYKQTRATTNITTLLARLRHAVHTLLQHVQAWSRTLSPAMKQQLLVLALAVLVLLLYLWLKKSPPPSPPAPDSRRDKPSRIKNSSLVSMRQYESHSDTDPGEVAPPRSRKNEAARKITREFREFCTDIEPSEAGEGKRDKFFFTLVSSYQRTRDRHPSRPSRDSDDYTCEYDRDPELAPPRNPKLLPARDSGGSPRRH